MRKVIGIGETILDILFRNGQPTAAVPGGSVFNGLVSLSRAGVPIRFISETGNDQVGNIILQFMRDNGMPTEHVNVFPDGKSPVSLAFLNERNDAAYLFYKDYPRQRLDVVWPEVNEDDIVILGSYYALNPVLRDKIVELLDTARAKKAIVYYDPNFRSTYKEEAIKLAPTIIENLEYADIVRGSVDDFFYMYNLQDVDKIYKPQLHLHRRTQRHRLAHGSLQQGLPYSDSRNRQHRRRRRQLQRRYHLRPVEAGYPLRRPERPGRSALEPRDGLRHRLRHGVVPQPEQQHLPEDRKRSIKGAPVQYALNAIFLYL